MIVPIAEIEWVEVPEDLKRKALSYLKEWWWLLPTWVQTVQVRYEPACPDTLQMRINHRTRWIVLILTGHFFACSEDDRHGALRHEFVHVLFEPALGVIQRMIVNLTEKETPLRKTIDGEFLEGMEATVEDTAYVLGKIPLKGKRKS